MRDKERHLTTYSEQLVAILETLPKRDLKQELPGGVGGATTLFLSLRALWRTSIKPSPAEVFRQHLTALINVTEQLTNHCNGTATLTAEDIAKADKKINAIEGFTVLATTHTATADQLEHALDAKAYIVQCLRELTPSSALDDDATSSLLGTHTK